MGDLRELADGTMMIWYPYSSIEQIEIVEISGAQMWRVFRGAEVNWGDGDRHSRTLIRSTIQNYNHVPNYSVFVVPCDCPNHDISWYFHDEYLRRTLEEAHAQRL